MKKDPFKKWKKPELQYAIIVSGGVCLFGLALSGWPLIATVLLTCGSGILTFFGINTLKSIKMTAKNVLADAPKRKKEKAIIKKKAKKLAKKLKNKTSNSASSSSSYSNSETTSAAENSTSLDSNSTLDSEELPPARPFARRKKQPKITAFQKRILALRARKAQQLKTKVKKNIRNDLAEMSENEDEPTKITRTKNREGEFFIVESDTEESQNLDHVVDQNESEHSFEEENHVPEKVFNKPLFLKKPVARAKPREESMNGSEHGAQLFSYEKAPFVPPMKLILEEGVESDSDSDSYPDPYSERFDSEKEAEATQAIIPAARLDVVPVLPAITPAARLDAVPALPAITPAAKLHAPRKQPVVIPASSELPPFKKQRVQSHDALNDASDNEPEKEQRQNPIHRARQKKRENPSLRHGVIGTLASVATLGLYDPNKQAQNKRMRNMEKGILNVVYNDHRDWLYDVFRRRDDLEFYFQEFGPTGKQREFLAEDRRRHERHLYKYRHDTDFWGPILNAQRDKIIQKNPSLAVPPPSKFTLKRR